MRAAVRVGRGIGGAVLTGLAVLLGVAAVLFNLWLFGLGLAVVVTVVHWIL
jgi:hypothetical protein